MWFGLLTYFAFAGVTLLGVTDADFFLVERQTELPLIGVSIPTNLFFYFAPILGVAIYTYLHHHLMKLWVALGTAPETIRNLPLSDYIVPWIVIDLALDLRPNHSLRQHPLPVLANAVTIFLVFLGPPLVLAAFWWRSMPAHSWWMTLVCCGLSLLFSMFIMTESGRALWRLRHPSGGDTQRPRSFLDRGALQAIAGWALCAVLIFTMGYTRTVEPVSRAWHLDKMYSNFLLRKDASLIERLSLVQQDEMRRQHFEQVKTAPWNHWLFRLSSANLDGVVFVEKPDSWRDFKTARTAFRVVWCRTEGLPPDICGPVPSAFALMPDYIEVQRNGWCSTRFIDMARLSRGTPEKPATFGMIW